MTGPPAIHVGQDCGCESGPPESRQSGGKPLGYWEHFPHGSDIGVRGVGPDKAGAFAQAAVALTAVITEPVRVLPMRSVQLTCKAPDDELLLAEWLNALVFEMATRRMLFSQFEVCLGAGTLEATAWGEPVDIARHAPAVEVKGATYTALKVRPNPGGGWLAQCVVDV